MSYDELIKSGAIDITTREATENEFDREARAKEPDAYALTYEESITILRAYNIIETVLIQNDFIAIDQTTKTRMFTFSPDSIQKIIDAFTEREFDPDALYTLAESVLSNNWYTLLVSTHYSPGNGKGFGFSLVANVNGKRDEGILKIEDYPAIYDGSNRTAQRNTLNLPKDARFLFSSEWEILTILRQVCNTQFFIEEKKGYLAPYDIMPNPIAFTSVSRFINNPLIREKDADTTMESVRFAKGSEGHECRVIIETRNSSTTLSIADYIQFFETAIDVAAGKSKKRHGTLSGVKKVWRFALQKLIQQSTAHTTPAAIAFDLKEMVANGMFTNVDNAYRGVEAMVKKIGLLHIAQDFTETVMEDGKKKQIKKSRGGYMFYASDRSGTIAHIFVNRQFGFEFFRRQYTYFPTAWAYKLGANAFSLTEYIFSLMRQNANEITESGKFRVKLSTVHNQLGLRSVEDIRENCNRRYSDFIKRPIKQAVDEINEAARKDNEIQGRFKIALKAPDTSNPDMWLGGHLEISANGEYVNYLTGIAETQHEEKVRQAAKRRTHSTRKKTAAKS